MKSEIVPVICPTCGTSFKGNYCFKCGEKKRDAHVLSIKHFLEESIEGFTHFDNKFFRSIKVLISKPGALTNHFEVGRRVPFMKPVQFFVICNLLFFLFSGGFNVFTVPLDNYLRYPNYTSFGTLRAYTEKFGSASNPDAVKMLFNEKVVQQSKIFIFIFIPFIALACYLLFFIKKRYFTLHLMFATHFFTFLLVFFMFFKIFFEIPNQYIYHFSPDTFEDIALLIIVPAIFLYLILAIRRYYKINWFFFVMSGIFLVYIFSQLLQFYRLGLFYKIIYSL